MALAKSVVVKVPKSDNHGSNATRLGRADWISAAKLALVKGGIHAVKVDKIARYLGITRGSFYWHFKSRAELLTALLELWREQNTAPFRAIAAARSEPAFDRFMKLQGLWLYERDFEPAFDRAIRDWAGGTPSVAAALARIDAERMRILEEIFLDLGYSATEAMIRARVTYYHQVGYYTLAVRESRETRRQFLPLYTKILTGFDLDANSVVLDAPRPRRTAMRRSDERR